ncbi:hypothetical protein AOR_1_352084 [Paecilomyces variotii No. 5]|uniref:Cenp-O kinetochore centromere component-domain-containing protein n=1 Tax=Byssochlamys spectabilis (strain No. 5 / NBRC 109023) TaxID=1356009 RepID=V5FKQ5_BYSSN|nr:hypothetical protein AOR_1_352084 [Paecilomyces variotii No. 5]
MMDRAAILSTITNEARLEFCRRHKRSKEQCLPCQLPEIMASSPRSTVSAATDDAEISAVREEIRSMQKRRRLLSNSLLASEFVQKYIQNHASPTDSQEISPLVLGAGKHNESNHHRIAFSATTFPFTDPSPHAKYRNLLGIRIDICRRDGRFSKPYYVLLKRDESDGKRLRVHRHTIPAFISMEKLGHRYLPVPARGADGEIDEIRVSKTRKQNLSAFVRDLRQELVAWHLRSDAIDWLRERLKLPRSGSDSMQLGSLDENTPSNKLGIISLSPTSLEARYVRLEWEDGRVGRFKISNNGEVVRVVIIGDNGRDKRTEDSMTSGNRRIESLLERLSQPQLSAG